MKNNVLYYSVGALLYCPANRTSIANSIISGQFSRPFSLALCLEDTIPDASVKEAEQILVSSLTKIRTAQEYKDFYLPKIFIRVRTPKQIRRLVTTLRENISILTGFILPKFHPGNASDYIHEIILANEYSGKKLYMMPIYESAAMVDLRTRAELLYSLKDSLDKVGELVLNIRVGGNDLCHLFGFRRHAGESIHKITPVSHIFSDIITVYGMDYVISGPVFEYYAGNNWEQGFLRELSDDRLCGFTGKTVIHPNQIPLVNQAYRVSQKDYADALSILEWNLPSSGVSANSSRERMNEYKTHGNWAIRTKFLAEVYGICEEPL